LAIGGLTILLAACGSQLAPEDVAALNGQPGVPGQNSTLAPGTIDPSTGATVGPGGTAGPGSTAGPGATAGPGSTAGPGGSAIDTSKVNCDGFKNQTGITDDKIVIANVADISGPVPGIFEASQDATKAFAAFFNATSDLCGRELQVLGLDSRADASADQQAYAKACEEAFAAVGSMSAYDSGGAATAENCGIPDLRAAPVTNDRNECNTCFGAQSVDSKQFENAVPDYFLKTNKAATQKAAFLYINVGAAAENGKNQSAAMQKRGFNFVYVDAIDVAEFNYAPYVQQMKSKGVRWVQFLGAYQQAAKLAQTMRDQGFTPDAYVLDPTAYTPDYIKTGGEGTEGTYLFVNFTPFEEAGGNKELQLYTTWLNQVNPGAQPTFFGLFSWSAARLFVQEAAALGGKLTRSALVDRLEKVDNWTGNGLHGPQHVGAKNVGDCWRFLRVKGGKFVAEGSTKYSCNGVTTVG
jgi:ABC-type branched-subunit amino acid transport system substrate-binding protein